MPTRFFVGFLGLCRGLSVTRSARLAGLMLTVLCWPMAPSALAQTATWVGTGTNASWHTASNWSPAAVPGATSDVVIPAGAGSVSISTADVTVASLTVARPMTVASGRTLAVTTATVGSAMQVNGTLSGGDWAALPGAQLIFPNSCSVPGQLRNVAIHGNFPSVSGSVRWNGVVLNGTLTVPNGANFFVEGDQVLTGTIVGSSNSSAVSIAPWTPESRLVIAESASVRGGRVEIGLRRCQNEIFFFQSIVNRGTVLVSDSEPTSASIFGRFENAGIVSGDVQFNQTLVNYGRLRGRIRVSQLMDLAGRETELLEGTVFQIGAEIRGGVLRALGGQLQFPLNNSQFFDCGGQARMSSLVIDGEIDNVIGNIIWNDIAIKGTITLRGQPASGRNQQYIFFDGNQLITGRIVIASAGTVHFSPWKTRSSVLTVASGAEIVGANLLWWGTSQCESPAQQMSIVNLGAIRGTPGLDPIRVFAPFLNAGEVSGSVSVPSAGFGIEWNLAASNQTAIVSAVRADPGSLSAQTLAYQGMYVLPGAPFTLGSGETLNLAGGTGTLSIAPGATFTANGSVNGSIFNAGLLIIPITRAGLIPSVTGPGVVRVVPPVSLPAPNVPIVLSTPQIPVVAPSTLLVVGGSGIGTSSSGGSGGGGGASGGGSPQPGRTYRVESSVSIQGGVSWDGRLEVTGSFSQSATGVTRLFIAGDIAGETYSSLNIGQSASLSGRIEVVLRPELFDYLPAVGTTFDMVVAQGGITLPSGGLSVRTLMTAAGAQRLGLSLPAFSSGFAGDPNSLVVWPEDAFTYSLVNGGTTLRFTLVRPICGSAPTLSDVYLCPNSVGTFTASPIGFGPFTYQWYVENPQDPGEYIPVVDGVMPGIATFGGAASSTLSASDPALIRTRLYCVVSSSCGDQATNSATLIIASKCSPADVANTDGDTTLTGSCPDGVLDNGDFTAFFAGFFGDPADPLRIVADIANTDGETVNEGAGPDGAVDNGDFTAFFFYFFAGCE